MTTAESIRSVPACMIRTHFIGPSNYRGARIAASFVADRKTRVVVSYQGEATGSEAHIPAILALIAKANKERAAMGWSLIRPDCLLSCGEDGGGYVWAVQEVAK